MNIHPDSVLFITLDSCRFDTFLAASAPNPNYAAQLADVAQITDLA
jgi:hypothetical protein